MQHVHPVVGPLHQGDKCTFTVWAPEKKSVELLLENEKIVRHAMAMDELGYWSTTLSDILPGTKYRFRIDKENDLPDPASRWQPDGVHGASAVIAPAFDWTDQRWKGVPLSDMIIYELHVGTFTHQGTFDGVISKLGYLKKLGINAIEVMPVAQFPGTHNWGYDGVYPFAVQHSYGGVHGLKRLVNEAHAHGIAVILDVVYNHQGPEGNYLSAYAPYFTSRYNTFWGSAINFDDAYCYGVRNFYWQNALMWLDEFHIDGLRLDAVHAIWDFSAQHFLQVLKEKVHILEEKTGVKKVLIAEFDLNNPRYISPVEKGGYGLDGQWIDEFHHALHALVTGEVNGYYEDFGTIDHLARAMKDSYVYTGQFSKHRKKFFGKTPSENSYGQFVVFAQNHDQVGNRLLGDRITHQLSYEALKLTAATYLLSPHVPMLFMGEEYGEKNPFQYFISHTDKDLVEAVRKGRKEEFKYFNWQEEVPDPQAVNTFEQCILSWKQEDDKSAAVLLALYEHLIAFRKERKAMKGTERNHVRVLPPQGNILAYERNFDGDHIIIVLNFNNKPSAFNYPDNKKLKSIFDSSAKSWLGSGELSPLETTVKSPIQLNTHSAIILEVQ